MWPTARPTCPVLTSLDLGLTEGLQRTAPPPPASPPPPAPPRAISPWALLPRGRPGGQEKCSKNYQGDSVNEVCHVKTETGSSSDLGTLLTRFPSIKNSLSCLVCVVPGLINGRHEFLASSTYYPRRGPRGSDKWHWNARHYLSLAKQMKRQNHLLPGSASSKQPQEPPCPLALHPPPAGAVPAQPSAQPDTQLPWDPFQPGQRAPLSRW